MAGQGIEPGPLILESDVLPIASSGPAPLFRQNCGKLFAQGGDNHRFGTKTKISIKC